MKEITQTIASKISQTAQVEWISKNGHHTVFNKDNQYRFQISISDCNYYYRVKIKTEDLSISKRLKYKIIKNFEIFDLKLNARAANWNYCFAFNIIKL